MSLTSLYCQIHISAPQVNLTFECHQGPIEFDLLFIYILISQHNADIYVHVSHVYACNTIFMNKNKTDRSWNRRSHHRHLAIGTGWKKMLVKF